MNSKVNIGRLELKNPVILASGTFGEEYAGLIDISKLGAIITKTITLKGRTGNLPPRIAETASGMLNSIGLENKGLDDLLENKLPALAVYGTPIIVSISADDYADFKELAARLNLDGSVAAVEINLSCPNVRHGDRKGLIAQDPDAVKEIVSLLKGHCRMPVIAKLSPNISDINEPALAAEAAGADAITVANTFIGMAIDIGTMKPKLGNVTGGLSGPCIKPIVLRLVYESAKVVRIPVIASGGIMDVSDAVEFIIAGASCVQVGTASFVNPGAAGEIVKGIERYMKEHKISDIGSLRGKIRI